MNFEDNMGHASRVVRARDMEAKSGRILESENHTGHLTTGKTIT